MCTIDDYAQIIGDDLMAAVRNYRYISLICTVTGEKAASTRHGIRVCMYAIALWMLYGGDYA